MYIKLREGRTTPDINVYGKFGETTKAYIHTYLKLKYIWHSRQKYFN